MITLKQRCQTEEYKFARDDFLDDFRLSPRYELIRDSVLDLANLNEIQKAMLAATVDSVCSEVNMDRPEWVYDPSTFLKHPYFAMNAKGDLRLILLQESPKWFRSRNLFVTANCLERV